MAMSEVNRMSGVRPARDISKARPAGVPSLSKLPPDAHKGDAGRVLLLVGSDAMPGAAVLATRAALRGGAGLVHVASHQQGSTEGSWSLPLPSSLNTTARRAILDLLWTSLTES